MSGWGQWGEAAFSEALEDAASFCEEVMGAVLLGAGDEGEGSCEHV